MIPSESFSVLLNTPPPLQSGIPSSSRSSCGSSPSYVISLQPRARVLSLKLFHPEDQLRQLLLTVPRTRRPMALLSRSSEIAALKERIDELERSEADLRASVEEILEIMARGEEGNEFVEKEEIREDLGEYSGDFTGATVPEGLDPGVPEVEDMALPYGKQMSSFGCDFSMPLSRWQVGVFPEFSGKEYENFMDVAEKLLSDYDLVTPRMLSSFHMEIPCLIISVLAFFQLYVPIPSLFPFLYFMIRDLQVAKRVEDVGFYAGFFVLKLEKGGATKSVRNSCE
ncbi:hypothetical protein J5N97_029602 [Dioscorea zingiberensis]|uniref:Uncharacterized protein n=1 Tax=Dioscorea zingiberensis TaxID=325984 RepID=A0A9D5H3D3_9LILI|nr:hypothetical protein J5N97_029602 [Dioscorea zingiberensis]